jgi:DNA-directed RNA polymerase specialized sigma24 family protein
VDTARVAGALQRGDEVHELRAWLYRIVHNVALNQVRVAGTTTPSGRSR